jgi:valyl-tRNA synthetase
MENLSPQYNPNAVEEKIYKVWERSGYFNPDRLPSISANSPRKSAFCIVMPPPNVTGNLHVGHALMVTIEDIIIRFKRMRGFKTLWLPGTDHAAIATQSKVEKLLENKEGKSKYDIGREKFLKRVEEFAKASHDTIVSQLKSMGASCDWSREAFTLDEKRNLAVRTAFKRLFDLGLIYRSYRVVNWDVKGQTTISDDEVVYVERPAKFYTFRYNKNFPIAISTTRPETKVGDTAVAVHPDDERYAKYVGKEYAFEFCGVPVKVKIIADKSVEKDFGTGAVGVTPAHSMIDYEIALRHNLPLKQIIDEHGRMTVGKENLYGKKTAEAREIIVGWLKSEGLLEKEEEIKQNVATAERTGGIIEPLPKLQWFIDVNKEFELAKDESGILPAGQKKTNLKELMNLAVRPGQIEIIPEHFLKTYRNWIENLRDWCISRQIWYGHRIPVWYKGDKVYCDVIPPQGDGWEQDPDTLDTWFSSGLWTFSSLGWPENTPDLQTYHPTDVLETGYDILFFWVARMILMTITLTGQIPFRKVLLHGIVRDAEKKKMSKSKGNVIDPLDMTAKYGTDALRLALVFNTAPGTDMAMSEDKVRGMKYFVNKLWNIARYVITNTSVSNPSAGGLFHRLLHKPANFGGQEISNPEAKTEADKEILAKLAEITKQVTKDLDNFLLHEAAQEIYQFTWHEFADKYIEVSKKQLRDETLRENTERILICVLEQTLKLLHPFTPFVTEEIWGRLPGRGRRSLLMVEKW